MDSARRRQVRQKAFERKNRTPFSSSHNPSDGRFPPRPQEATKPSNAAFQPMEMEPAIPYGLCMALARRYQSLKS
jgi:hypothetical protein